MARVLMRVQGYWYTSAEGIHWFTFWLEAQPSGWQPLGAALVSPDWSN